MVFDHFREMRRLEKEATDLRDLARQGRMSADTANAIIRNDRDPDTGRKTYRPVKGSPGLTPAQQRALIKKAQQVEAQAKKEKAAGDAAKKAAEKKAADEKKAKAVAVAKQVADRNAAKKAANRRAADKRARGRR